MIVVKECNRKYKSIGLSMQDAMTSRFSNNLHLSIASYDDDAAVRQAAGANYIFY